MRTKYRVTADNQGMLSIVLGSPFVLTLREYILTMFRCRHDSLCVAVGVYHKVNILTI
jgi:hypothetical protein